jgi:enoyl-CoA hydratase/carnithine racemase
VSAVLTHLEDEILHITLNRPDSLNAMDNALVEEVRQIFTDLYWRRDARVVILTGAGRAFCAGLDLKAWDSGGAERSTAQGLDGQRRIAEIVIAMRRCPQPIIALVNGPASGGGFALALASDVRLVTPTAKMNAAFIRIGLSACDIGVSYFLPRMVGASVAAEYMLTGRFFTPERAHQLGLVSDIVAPEELQARGRALAEEMLHATPLGLRLTKEALNMSIDAGGLEAVIAMEDRNQVLTARDANFAEGVAAFLEKRKPTYR